MNCFNTVDSNSYSLLLYLLMFNVSIIFVYCIVHNFKDAITVTPTVVAPVDIQIIYIYRRWSQDIYFWAKHFLFSVI